MEIFPHPNSEFYAGKSSTSSEMHSTGWHCQVMSSDDR